MTFNDHLTGGCLWPPKWLDGAAAHTEHTEGAVLAQPIGSRGLGGGSGTL